MEKNAEDGGNRRFVLVQIPEETTGQFSTLTEIGEERIRRAGAKIAAEIDESNQPASSSVPIQNHTPTWVFA